MTRPARLPRWRVAIYEVARTTCMGVATTLTVPRYFDVPDLRRVGGLLMASNHQSYLDPVLVGMSVDRPVRFLARDDLFGVPGFGAAIHLVGAYPVRRGEPDRQALKAALEMLRAGEALLVFPEGTRTRDGSIAPFKPGAAAIALRCGVPVLPVCVEGAFECWPRRRMLPRPARVAVAYGSPVRPEGMDARELTSVVVRQVREMQQRLRRHMGRPPIEEVTG